MSPILIELLVIVLLVMLNGVFALAELAIVSARRARLQEWVNEGRAGAQTALNLAKSPSRFLSTVQIGITLVGVLAGAFGGATIARALEDTLASIPAVAPYARPAGFLLVVLLITYLSLVIGELVPKQIALRNPEKTAIAIAGPMQRLSQIAGPLVTVLTTSSNLVVRGLGITPSEDRAITEEELRILLREGTREGVFRTDEQNMVESVFELDARYVRAVMTPYTEIAWLNADDSPDEIRAALTDHQYSRYPVGRGSLDNVLGVVHAPELLAQVAAGEPINLDAALRGPRFVPGNARITSVVELFKHTREHLVLVIDEHGSIEGLLTEHDLLEAIIGHLPTLHESDSEWAAVQKDGVWQLDGMMGIDRFKVLFALKDDLPGESRAGFTTLGGFVVSQIGDIPQVGECFVWNGLIFEVAAMADLRVGRVTVRRVGSPASEQATCNAGQAAASNET